MAEKRDRQLGPINHYDVKVVIKNVMSTRVSPFSLLAHPTCAKLFVRIKFFRDV